MLAVFLITKVGTWITKGFNRRRLRKARRERLHRLTVPERHVLQVYFETGSRTVDLPIDDGVVSCLMGCGILYRRTGMADFRRFPTHISEDAWLYLNEHPELLATPNQPRREPSRYDWMR